MSYNKAKKLYKILQGIKNSTPNIEGLILLTWDGLTIASNVRSASEEEYTSAICATLISLGENFLDAFNQGLFEYVHVKSKEKGIFLGKIIEEVGLVMITKVEAKLGVLIYELEKAKVKIIDILG